jgi:hypothetical protein
VRRNAAAASTVLALVLAACAGGTAATRGGSGGGDARAAAPRFVPASGHRLAGFSLDRDWLVLAENPAAAGACPVVELVRLPAGPRRPLTRPGGESCRFGGHFWVRPGMRAVGNAIAKALWVLRRGSVAEAVKASPTEAEALLERRTGITADRGPFLGPVVATNWLRLFGDYTRGLDGTLVGGAISANDRQLWASSGPVIPLGLDDQEHAVAVGADGSIAMWHAHGAHYGVVPDAHARTAALDGGEVLVLRSDLPQLDIRLLSGNLVRSWPVAHDAKPLLDADVPGNVAVYLAGRAVHELRLDDGRDSVVARAPRGSTLLDAQIEKHFLAYAYRGGPGGPGRVVVLRR